MNKVVVGYVLGLACLFLCSLLEKQMVPNMPSPTEKDYRRKKLRLSMSSFDLANGLTFKELEDIFLDPTYRFAAFLSLLASLWLVRGLRYSRKRL